MQWDAVDHVVHRLPHGLERVDNHPMRLLVGDALVCRPLQIVPRLLVAPGVVDGTQRGVPCSVERHVQRPALWKKVHFLSQWGGAGVRPPQCGAATPPQWGGVTPPQWGGFRRRQGRRRRRRTMRPIARPRKGRRRRRQRTRRPLALRLIGRRPIGQQRRRCILILARLRSCRIRRCRGRQKRAAGSRSPSGGESGSCKSVTFIITDMKLFMHMSGATPPPSIP